MVAVQSAIPLLRFRAGTLHLGIAAEDVALVHSGVGEGSTIHIASLLGVEPSGAACKTVQLPRPARLVDGPEVLSFQADTPLGVQQCETEHLLPLPRGVSFRTWKPIMGFAQLGDDLVLLLDIPSLFSTLMERYQRGSA